MNINRLIGVSIVALVCPFVARAFNDTGIRWMYTETTHFNIVYHSESAHTASEVASKCETFYANIASFFGIKPPPWKITIVVKGKDDIANGFALYNYDLIQLWTVNLHYPIRDKHRWIDNVLYHELTHIFQEKLSSATDPSFPAIIVNAGLAITRTRALKDFSLIDPVFQAGGVIIYPTAQAPSWFVEGVAQYVASRFGNESYDSIREMIMRTLVLEEKFPLPGELLNFRGKRGIKSEIVYNAGFSLSRYIADNFGNDALASIAVKASAFPGAFEQAVKKTLGISYRELYSRWRSHVEEYVYRVTASIKNPDVEKPFISKDRGIQMLPRITHSGLYYLSYSPSRGKSRIMLLTRDAKTPRVIVSNVGGGFDVDAYANFIVYVKRKLNMKNHIVKSIYVMDLTTGKTHPLV